MSKARDALVELICELRHEPGLVLSDEEIVDKIMPIVRNTVSLGFKTAADQLDLMDLPDGKSDCIDYLRRWAEDARTASA